MTISLDHQNLFIKSGHQTLSPYVFSATLTKKLQVPKNIEGGQDLFPAFEIKDPQLVATVHVPKDKLNFDKGIKDGDTVELLIQNYSLPFTDGTEHHTMNIYDHRQNKAQHQYIIISLGSENLMQTIHPQGDWQKQIAQTSILQFPPEDMNIHIVDSPEQAALNIYTAYLEKDKQERPFWKSCIIPAHILEDGINNEKLELLFFEEQNKETLSEFDNQLKSIAYVRTLPIDLPIELKDMIIQEIKNDPSFFPDFIKRHPEEKKRFKEFFMEEFFEHNIPISYSTQITGINSYFDASKPWNYFKHTFKKLYNHLQEI